MYKNLREIIYDQMIISYKSYRFSIGIFIHKHKFYINLIRKSYALYIYAYTSVYV